MTRDSGLDHSIEMKILIETLVKPEFEFCIELLELVSNPIGSDHVAYGNRDKRYNFLLKLHSYRILSNPVTLVLYYWYNLQV